MADHTKHIIEADKTLKDAIVRLNDLANDLTLFVVDNENKLIGTLTDGDIRRGVVSGNELSSLVSACMHTNFRFMRDGSFGLDELDKFRKERITMVPLLNDGGEIIRIINFSDLRSYLQTDVVIMAGGAGKRLSPLTDAIPKALLKVGDKPIIEHNIERFLKYGVNKVHISIRHLGEMIEKHFDQYASNNLKLEFFRESTPLGTIGSLALIENFINDYILVLNCDILTDIDYEDFVRSAIAKDADMAIGSKPFEVEVPYAVLETIDESVKSLKEKPAYTYYSNAGIYLLKKEILEFIPKNEKYDATDLISNLIAIGRRVVHYPLLGYWLDIGKIEDYQRAQRDIAHIRL